MNEFISQKIEEKIHETSSNKDELKKLEDAFSFIDDNSKSFLFGIVVGRLYNAFYYQTKRLLKREPNDSEFREFLELIESKKSDLENLW